MRIFATLIAVGASFVLASGASAASITILGPNTPGTNTYQIQLSFTTAEQVAGFATSVKTSGTYTGSFTETIPGGFPIALPGPTVTGGATGVAGSWAAISSSAHAGGTFIVGTVVITVSAGQFVTSFFTGADGLTTPIGDDVPTTLNGLTIVPEPATAALLSLGIAGVAVAGRWNRDVRPASRT